MATAAPIVLILGAGSNIGQHVARVFAGNGYRVATTSRKAQSDDGSSSKMHVQVDLNDPNSVKDVFKAVKDQWGHPSVVVYNAASAHFNKPDAPSTLSVQDVTDDLNVNTLSAFTAATEAVAGFEKLDTIASRSFIYTGNALNEGPMAGLLGLGLSKAATAHIIEHASMVYKTKGFRFYFVDERKPDGKPVGSKVDGSAHASMYWDLAEGNLDVPWQVTFVKGEGYKDFHGLKP